MRFFFPPFEVFVDRNSTASTRSKVVQVNVTQFQLTKNNIKATVQGTSKYQVEIKYDNFCVLSATCSCPYDYQGVCKHIVKVLAVADDKMRYEAEEKRVEQQLSITGIRLKELKEINPGEFLWENKTFNDWLESASSKVSHKSNVQNYRILTGKIEAHSFFATVHENATGFRNVKVHIAEENNNLLLACSCHNETHRPCQHILSVLQEMSREELLRLSFDDKRRQNLITLNTKEYGLNESVEKLDQLFYLALEYGRIFIRPRFEIFDLGEQSRKELKEHLLPNFVFPKEKSAVYEEFVVIDGDPDMNHFSVRLMQAPLSKNGEIKSPITPVSLPSRMKKTNDKAEIDFLLTILQASDLEINDDEASINYSDLIKNPLNLPFYFDARKEYGQKITPRSLKPIELKVGNPELTIFVDEIDGRFVLTCKVKLSNNTYSAFNFKLMDSFFKVGKKLFWIKNENIKRIIKFFQVNGVEINLFPSQFETFKTEFLDNLEDFVTVKYSFVHAAPQTLIQEKSLNRITKYLIYLSESDDYILITPVVAYGDREISVLSKKSLHITNSKGEILEVDRNERMEKQFLHAVQKQHPSFEELPETDFFYLHKQEFLDDGWFLDAFENWRALNYQILGFNKLKNNHFNENKMKVEMSVKSGIDWFDVKTKVSFGDQMVDLKAVQKAVLNKKRFVSLGDDTNGLLPEEWIDKYGNYFRSGEINGDFLRMNKCNFQLIDDLFEEEILDDEVHVELEKYREKLANFHSIRNVNVPKKLKATLRDYQKEGLNWLNFLDEFGFGGCLADDMGLGKTVQVIAHFLAQKEKGIEGTNLVILPTSLIFNWQAELDRFAPSLQFLAVYGPNREVEKIDFSKYDVILTTYGTLLSDVAVLKNVLFNYVVLDESQAIKNPSSKRYKAVRLLQASRRLVLTGTPVENNTFDLFAQLSFAMPGLFGSSTRFKDDYSTPIDKFQDVGRANELQKRVHPFILRRTKKQVAKELPEKTEMVIYCEMGVEQRKVYEAYKTEFQKFLSKSVEKEDKNTSLHILQGLTKLRQICDSPALLGDEEYYGNDSSKLEELLEQIRTLTGEHKVLIFSQFVGMLDLIKEKLVDEKIPFAYLTGQTKDRQEQVDLFQTDENTRIFLISLKAGGTGLNLTEAEYVFIVDPWWNPAVENQAIDRAYRIGQQNKVVAIRLICKDTIEEKIMELQSKKKQLVDDLIHTDTNILKQLSKNDLLKLV